MSNIQHPIKIDFLDHVAIRVKDMNASIVWYEKVLGLKKYQLPEWGEFPIFMLANRSGLALFPANLSDKEIDTKSRNVKIDHFSFNVDNESFEKAIQLYTELNLDFNVQDHHYFQSIYTKDPDGHTVELTTIKVDAESYYNAND